MRRSISENNRKLQPKTVAVQNTSNRFEQSERKKRKLPSLSEDEEPVFLEEDDDEIKKKYIQKFRMSCNPSNTNSKSHNFVSDSITRLLSTDESVDVEVQCEPLIEKKDAEVQCITVSLKDAEVQNDLLKEKENTESKCKCQYWDQEFNLLSLMQQCVNTPKGKNKDLNQLIQLCKKLIKKTPAELKNNNNETPTSRKLRNSTNVNRSQALPELKTTVKKRKTKDTFKKPATADRAAIPSSTSSISISYQTRLRERSSYQGFQSLTLGERKKRKLYSPTVWERSKRFSESLVKDPNPHKLFL